jgi:flagellar biosynthesis chaperone FliJ
VTADLRRFEYALEPLRQQRRWQLDALEARLGRVTREVQRAAEELEALRVRHQEESRRAAERISGTIDPGGYGRVLAWLADRVRAMRAAQGQLEELRAERSQVRAACLVQQQKLDVIERHRGDCLAEFAIEEQNRQSAEADREWLVRRSWSAAHAEGSREEGTT